MLRRAFFRWILIKYEDKEGFFWKMSGAALYGIYSLLLDFEVWKHRRHVENIDLEKGQLELLSMMVWKK